VNAVKYFVTDLMPYMTAAIFLLGFYWKIRKWAKSPRNLHWELFPYPQSNAEQIGELIVEVVILHSLFLHNRKIWLPSLAMHWGIYHGLIGLLLLTAGLPRSVLFGFAGAVLLTLGALGLIIVRLSFKELRSISAPQDYIQLVMLAAIGLTTLTSNIPVQYLVLKDYIRGLASFNPDTAINSAIFLPLLLLQIFILYMPFSRMSHFAAKYFTYHKVKWGEPQ